jgi:hypothetical protein
MWKQEGFQGFMKGNGINVVRVSDGHCEALRMVLIYRFCHTLLYNSQ